VTHQQQALAARPDDEVENVDDMCTAIGISEKGVRLGTFTAGAHGKYSLDADKTVKHQLQSIGDKIDGEAHAVALSSSSWADSSHAAPPTKIADAKYIITFLIPVLEEHLRAVERIKQQAELALHRLYPCLADLQLRDQLLVCTPPLLFRLGQLRCSRLFVPHVVSTGKGAGVSAWG
jgi:hypothetical protein